MITRIAAGWLALAACVASGRVVPAQTSREATVGYVVTGTVVDPAGDAVSDAEIALVRHDTATRFVRSDESGRFRFDDLPSPVVSLRVRRLGFKARVVSVDFATGRRQATVFITLEAAVRALDPMNVDAEGTDPNSVRLREFYTRARSNHFGHFIDEQQLDEMRPEHTSDALRGIPGVVVRPSRRIGNEVRIRGCAPLVWVDGTRAPGAQLDDVTHGSDVAAIEIYNSQAGVPAQYTDRSATCGTILVWLRTG